MNTMSLLCMSLQASGAELVIALTHMRVPNDIKLAQAVAEIDAVLGGHDHHVQVRCCFSKYTTQSAFLVGSLLTCHSGMRCCRR
jgi:2',3'-cyclic-nucleotide 2'-phosphodiesterase (5'-nucleotidase family)